MQQLLEKPATEGAAWKYNAKRLATWAMTRMVNRDDAHGSYFVEGNKPQARTARGRVDHALLVNHFAAARIIGLHTTSTDDTCRWLTIDVDRHDADAEDLVPRNDDFARHLYDDLRGRGFRPLLLDSNGKGGRHLTILFDGPVPAREVRAFGLWLVRGWAEHGLPRQPEVFPKQDSILKAGGEIGYGNFDGLLVEKEFAAVDTSQKDSSGP